VKARQISWRLGYLLAAFGIFLADQATKAWAVRSLRNKNSVQIISGFLDLSYAENSGIAFGQLQEGGSFGRWLLVGLAVAAAFAVLYYFFRTQRIDDRVLGACSLLLAGICGNLTDRVRLGHVIDLIDVHIGAYHWPTFNIADASICVGALLLAFDLFFERKKPAKDEKPRAGTRPLDA
jgi:signal peptidase II